MVVVCSIYDSVDELSARQWHEVLRLRASVFVVEQHCFYLDPDDADLSAAHLLAHDEGMLVGCARVLPPSLSGGDASRIGRVCIAKTHRDKKIGRLLLQQAVAYAQSEWEAHDIVISSQQDKSGYYERFGFVGEGQPYDDAGVAHIKMRLRPASP